MSSRAHSTRRLTALYVTALSTVALLSVLGQSLVQYSLHKQSADSRVINMAGRQRMLSQRIAKSALALTNVEEAEQRSRRRDELRIARDEWEQSHMGLRYGDADLGLAPNNSSRILALFADIQHPFEEMSRAVDAILAAPGANASAQIVADILLHEELFLAGMDAIVSQYENESRKRVERLRAIEMVLLATTLSTLLCEGLFVFRPAVRRLRQEFERVQAAEAREASIARELTTILDSAPALIWYQDEAGRFVRVNRAAAHAFETPAPELIGHRVIDVLGTRTNSFEAADSPILNDAASTRSAHVLLTRRDASVRRLRLSKVPFMNGRPSPEGLICIAEDITDREHLERALLHSRAEAQRKIGQDLHDDLGQTLTGVLYMTRRLEQTSRKEAPAVADSAREIVGLVKDAIQTVRNIVVGLCPLKEGARSLAPALNDIAEQTERVSGVECVFVEDIALLNLDDDQAEHAYRIAQEAVTNAIKHSGCSRIEITLSDGAEVCLLRVADDGHGVGTGRSASSGLGVRIMRRRAELMGGALRILDGVPHGTVVECRLERDGHRN